MEFNEERSWNKIARIAGLGYLVIIVCGILAELILRSSLIESGNPGATAQNITDNQGLFRTSIASDFVMLTFDAIVGVALFLVFRRVSAGVALLSTLFRALHTAVYGATLLALFFALELTTGPDYLSGITPDQAHALGLLFIEAHAFGYALALMFFAVHVVMLAYLVLKSGFLPRAIGGLLLFAGVGYLVDGFARIALADYASYENVFAIVVFAPAFVGELSFGGWLLLRGIRRGPSNDGMPAPVELANA